MKLKSKGCFFLKTKQIQKGNDNDIIFIIYSLYMTKSYINSRTINHVVIYSYT
jgi:hypothetical protein